MQVHSVNFRKLIDNYWSHFDTNQLITLHRKDYSRKNLWKQYVHRHFPREVENILIGLESGTIKQLISTLDMIQKVRRH